MKIFPFGVLAVLLALPANSLPQEGGKREGVRRGTIVKIDADKLAVTLRSEKETIEAVADEDTRFFEARGKNVRDKLASFPVGAEVQFLVRTLDGKNRLVGLRQFPPKKGPRPQPAGKFDSSRLVPLDELGEREYKEGFRGGFYPGGKNVRPAAHEDAGRRLAAQIQPLGADGKPDPRGKIVMVSIGMSNTSQASNGFRKALAGAEGLHPRFVFVNGALGGQTAARIRSTETPQGAKYWEAVDGRLKEAGLTPAQVQVAWIKQADAGPRAGFPAYAKTLEEELADIVRILPRRFPNIKLAYLSSRTYGGYATTGLNPEPYAYESGFSVKWLIERQIQGEAGLNFDPRKGKVQAPWLSWGPYLWANGSKKRADGFFYEAADFAADGTHHSAAGSAKIGRLMLEFFRTDATTRPWFTAGDR